MGADRPGRADTGCTFFCVALGGDGVYLACEGEGDFTEANPIHTSKHGVIAELEPFPGGLTQLAMAPDGTVYAAGYRRDEEAGEDRAVRLRRSH